MRMRMIGDGCWRVLDTGSSTSSSTQHGVYWLLELSDCSEHLRASILLPMLLSTVHDQDLIGWANATIK